MKTSVIPFLLLIFISLHCICQTEIETDWLKNNSKSLNSIDPKDENFEDLEFLIPILKDKDIVMLGEEAHSFAHTFAAKSRLIKFLHQRLGFNVLAFEINGFPLYEASLETKKQSDKLSPIQQRLYPFWYQATATQELFTYLENNKSMQVSGFDIQAFAWNPIIAMEDMLRESNSEILNYKYYNRFLSLFKNYYSQPIKDMNMSEFALLNMFIDDILYEGELKNSLNHEDKIVLKALDNFKNHLRNRIVGEATSYHMMGDLKPKDSLYGFLGDTRSMGAINRRDEQMAKNIQWLKEELYSEEKIIVWAASAHTMYDRQDMKKDLPKDFPFYTRFLYGYNYLNMGTHLKRIYNDKLYSLGFSPVSGTIDHSTSRSYNSIENVTRDPNSIEEKLMTIKGDYLYLDFTKNKAKVPQTLFNENMISNILGIMEVSGDISKFFDGILFMKDVKPITYID
jgi:erythromycin esterase-like protein